MRCPIQPYVLALLFAAAAAAQPAPDCQFTATFTSATAGTGIANKSTSTGGTPCVYWTVSYWTNGASGVSIKLEGAADAAGAPTGSYTALTATTGSNPMTGTTAGAAIMCCDYYPWLRLNPTTFTGSSQTMTARAYGWRTQPGSGSGGSASQDVNIIEYGGTPTTLGQKAAAASIPTVLASDQPAIPVTPAANSSVNLAQVGATNVLTGGVAGSQGIGGLAAAGAAPTGNPLPQGLRDGAGNIIVPDYCTLKATFATSASGNTQLVAVSSATTIRVCHIDWTGATQTIGKLVTGTGSSCTSSADETGVFTGAGGGMFGFAMDYASPLQTTAAKTLCLNLSTGSVGGGTVIYSQR